MLTLVVAAVVVVAVVLAAAFGVALWRLIRGNPDKVAAPDRGVDREFRKIARRIGRLDPPDDD